MDGSGRPEVLKARRHAVLGDITNTGHALHSQGLIYVTLSKHPRRGRGEAKPLRRQLIAQAMWCAPGPCAQPEGQRPQCLEHVVFFMKLPRWEGLGLPSEGSASEIELFDPIKNLLKEAQSG